MTRSDDRGRPDRRTALMMLGAALVATPALAQKGAAPPAAAIPSPAVPVGEAAEVEGNVLARLAGERQLETGAGIFLNESIETAEASRAVLRIGAGDRIHLGPKTQLTVDRFLAEAGGELVLGGGSIVFDRGEDQPKRDLQVRSAFGLIGLRGTRFFAGTLASGFSVFVQRGEVEVSADGVSRTVGPGQGVDIRAPGEPPGLVLSWADDRIAAAFATVLGG